MWRTYLWVANYTIYIHIYIYIYIYILCCPSTYTHACKFICIVLFGPVKPELGGIPSGQKTFYSEPLNFT